MLPRNSVIRKETEFFLSQIPPSRQPLNLSMRRLKRIVIPPHLHQTQPLRLIHRPLRVRLQAVHDHIDVALHTWPTLPARRARASLRCALCRSPCRWSDLGTPGALCRPGASTPPSSQVTRPGVHRLSHS